MSLNVESPPVQALSRDTGSSYRTLWRWHFYAGLFVMPLLVVLAITGSVYCLQPQLEPLLYSHLMRVDARPQPRLPADALLQAAQRGAPAGSTAVSLQVVDEANRSAEFVFRMPDGQQDSIFVDPYDGTVLGSLSVEHRFMQVARMLHRKLLLGKPGELIMELAACWTLVMIGSGVALWWPRGRQRRWDWRPRLALKGRPWWRSLHASLGIWLALGATAFVLTGLPWTGSWGRYFQALATSAQLGQPPGVWGDLRVGSRVPGAVSPPDGGAAASGASGAGHHHDGGAQERLTTGQLPVPLVPWAVAQIPVPDSRHSPATATPLPVSQAIARLARLGVVSGYSLALPSAPEGVYTATYFPADPKLERTIYMDQYSGDVIRDIGYADYGAVAQAVSYGTSLHMGRYFGVANQIVSILISLGLAAMAVTGAVMWWKRRPSGRLGAPSRDAFAPPMRGWKAGLVILGIVFPLMGLSMAVVWLADWLIFQRGLRFAA